MNRIKILLVALVSFPVLLFGQYEIENEQIKIEFDAEKVSFSVLDKRINKTWTQLASHDIFKVEKVKKKNNQLEIDLVQESPFTAIVSFNNEGTLTFEIRSKNKSEMKEITFPRGFQAPDKEHYIVMTDGEGFLWPVDDEDYPVSKQNVYWMGGGLCMPWIGMVDKEHESGYMFIMDTPNDLAMHTFRKNGLVHFDPVWLPEKGKFGYSRKVHLHFFDRGGYVAQAKTYRKYVWTKNIVPNLKEKVEKQPDIDKIVGAPQLYLWDKAREVSFLKELNDAGIDRAFIFWDPSHLPYPVEGYDEEVRKHGYLSGVYELFRDVHLKDTAIYQRKGKDKEMTLHRYHYPGMFHDIVLKNKKGEYSYSGFGYEVNPKAIFPLIPSLRLDREMPIYPHDSYFIDAFLAGGLHECYRKDYPLTRTEYRKAVVDIHQYFIQDRNLIVGGEWGADFGVPYTAYLQGMTTLHKTAYGSEREDPGTIYYGGDWENNERPTMMVGSWTATQTYHQWAINEKIRVPLYQLVYHDAIVSTWRWDDANHHMPELWWKKDLFSLLYGTCPLWTFDKRRWDAYKNTFIDSFQTIAEWLRTVGYEELVNHEFITKDGKIQKSTFSSDKIILVNFGDAPYDYDGVTIKPKAFLVL